MRDSDQKLLIFLGVSGFPFGLAAIQRQTLMAKALQFRNWSVIIICPRSVHPPHTPVKKVGRFENIKYIYLFEPHRPPSFIRRNFQKLLAPFKEFLLLWHINRRQKIRCAIISSRNSFAAACKYAVFSWFFRYKTALNLVEIYSGKGVGLLMKLNDILFNSFCCALFDLFLPISHKIIEFFDLKNKPHVFIPIIVDAEKVELGRQNLFEKGYVLFCAAAAYYRSFDFVISSYAQINRSERLLLIANGSKAELNNITALINSYSLESRVTVLQNVSQNELFGLFKGASLLLLPLFPTLKDEARFPHKLGEYLASGTVVLSNPVGEINYYLNHGHDVIFSEAGNIQEFARQINWILDHPDEARKIGGRGREIALNYFDYRSISSELDTFFENFRRKV